MKIQNIIGGLLLVIASQAAYAVENKIFNISTKPIRITLVYKNNQRDVKMLEPFPSKTKKGNQLFIQTTQANPIKEIFFNYIGIKGLWSASINYTKKIEEQSISIYDDGWAYINSYYFTPGDTYMPVENNVRLETREVPEDV